MSVLQSATLSLTAAQILALVETPITIIPAPDASHYTNIISWTLEYKFKTTPYTVPSNTDSIELVPAADPVFSTLLSILWTGFVDQNVSMVAGLASVIQSLNSNDNAVTLAHLKGQAIQVSATADVTDGDGLLYMVVYYTTEAVL